MSLDGINRDMLTDEGYIRQLEAEIAALSGDLSRAEQELAGRWDAATQGHYEDMEARLGRLDVTAANMAAALEGVLNSACHPDIAIRAVLVPLEPVRDALAQYHRFCKPPTP